MAEQKNRWKWDVSGFQTRNSSSPQPPSIDYDRPHRRESAQLPRYSISSTLPSNRALISKVDSLSSNLKVAKEDYLELRQEANELQEYSRAKLDRVTRYLGVLADKTRSSVEWRIAPLINAKKKLFDDLLTAKAELFNDIQPFVQSALDGFNVSIFSYGQTNSGKTHTLVGSSHERGLIVRCFKELFDLANSDTYATS